MPVATPAVALTSPDTLVGRVYDTQDAPDAQVMAIQTRDGTIVALGGQPSIAMRALANAGALVEAWVIGSRDGTTMEVDAFEVVRVGGQPVDDGVLTVSGNRVSLVTRTGERRIIDDAPAQLRYMAGSRIWIVRATPRPNPPYGIIVRR